MRRNILSVFISLLIFTTMQLALAATAKSEAADPAKDKNDITKAEFDTDKMHEKYAQEPSLSKDSDDQNKTDKVRSELNKNRVEHSLSSTEALVKCNKQQTLVEIQKCRKKLQAR